MSPLRLALISLAAVLASACGMIEADPHRFERWGEAVAAIPVSAEEAGLRGMIDPADRPETPRPAMRIEVVEPEALWQARADGFGAPDLRGPIEAAARAGGEAVVQAAAERLTQAVAESSAPGAEGLTVQLGAFSSPEAARSAWARLSGQAPLSGLNPQVQPVERDGRTLYRLRAGPVAPEAVTAVCRAAGAGEWCASTARS